MEQLAIMIVAFFMCFLVYRQGIKDGQRLQHEQTIQPIIKSPVTAYKEHTEGKEVKADSKVIMQGIENMLAYDGTPQKEVIK